MVNRNDAIAPAGGSVEALASAATRSVPAEGASCCVRAAVRGYAFASPCIVQEGKDDGGAAVRWRFTEITPDSFHWLGERSPDGGATWQLQAEFFARRVGG